MKTLMVIFLFFSTCAAEAKPHVEALKRAAKKVGVPPELLKAICTAESNLRPSAYVHADGGDENSAFGMCQILYRTARGMGFKGDSCLGKDFNKLPRTYKNCNLFGPYTNSYWAARYLKYQLNRYNGSWISAIAAYNTGSLKICKTGKVIRKKDRKVLYTCQKGGLYNQRYVDRVLRALQEN